MKGKHLAIIGVIVGGIWFLNRKASAGGGSGYLPKFHRDEKIIAPTRLPTDAIYVVTDVYYNSGEWMYSLAQLFEGQVINDMTGFRAQVVDSNYVLLSAVT